jgi:hypothetical protein
MRPGRPLGTHPIRHKRVSGWLNEGGLGTSLARNKRVFRPTGPTAVISPAKQRPNSLAGMAIAVLAQRADSVGLVEAADSEVPMTFTGQTGSESNAGDAIHRNSATYGLDTTQPHSRTLDEDEPWQIVLTSCLNVLVTGPTGATRVLVEELRLRCRGAVLEVPTDEPLALPALTVPATVILHDVDTLGRVAQIEMFNWLDGIEQTRVITTSNRPLLPLVAAGVFLDTLYYRLNTVHYRLARATQRFY